MKYKVTYYYHTQCTVEVEADSPEEAVVLGDNVDTDDQIIFNILKDGDPDVEVVN